MGAHFEPQLSDRLIDLQAAVAAPFERELAFVSEVGKVALLAHRLTHQVFRAVMPDPNCPGRGGRGELL